MGIPLPGHSKRKPTDMIEKHVVKQISDFMELRGWRRFRNSVGKAMGFTGGVVSFGEVGMPDLRFAMYFAEPMGASLNIWVEVKRPGAVDTCRCAVGDKVCRTCHQKKWRRDERLRKAVVVRVDNLVDFETWYNSKFSWLHTGDFVGQGRLF